MTNQYGDGWFANGDPDDKPFRKSKDSKLWHSRRDCPHWPTFDYTSSWRPIGKWCQECKALNKKRAV